MRLPSSLFSGACCNAPMTTIRGASAAAVLSLGRMED